jgi:hypothetical protein
MNNQTDKAVGYGLAGFGLGMIVTAFVLGKETNKLEKKNKTSFELHKQLIDDTRADMADATISSGELWNRMAHRLNFITTSKLI